MRIGTAASYPVSIFIAGDWFVAEAVCGEFCDEMGLCVTITQTRFIYTGGDDDGIIVGLINYPRFPKAPEEIWTQAETLAARLLCEMGQESYTIQSPDKTVWFSHRAADQAQAIEARRAETGTGSVHESAVAMPCAQTPGKDA